MNKFTLHPFLTESSLPLIKISGQIERDNHILSIEYLLQGDLSSVSIAAPVNKPSRQFYLWEATCFEFFLGVPGNRNYWEFNLSPSGDWNVFRLDDYRQGLRDEIAFTSLPFTVDRSINLIGLKLAFDLSGIMPIDLSIEIAIATVIKSTQGEMSYWALKHSGKEADFHLRDSFTIEG
ncbi:DOMON-like domain-containing protein [Chamaesiphon sp. VAR_48_metabat_135_sub]|uniref:DOMON-like domain-containing protein n=1 Tax=Chamaesiphon sp. VAR_48_metabat_135_sub TaxID=2964699 RepID=UPI00286BFB03|nr:DOMON-like domain-containing protein [Chamaesiphon sp. VAR_48_metabat_135_sub]